MPWGRGQKEGNAQSMHKAKGVANCGGLSSSEKVVRMAGGNWALETDTPVAKVLAPQA